MTIEELIERLVDPDERRRNQAVDFVRNEFDAGFRIWLTNELIGRLGLLDEQQQLSAEETIIDFGRDAVHPVRTQLLGSKDISLQLKLVRILEEIGVRATPEDSPDVSLSLLVVANAVRSEEVIHAGMRAVARMRWPDSTEQELEERAGFARIGLVRRN